jgi:hypothetical protein
VEHGPQDLTPDFQSISATFASLRAAFQQSYYMQNAQIQAAWFQAEQANIDLRQVWYGGAIPTPTPVQPPAPRLYVCQAENLRGEVFSASGWGQAAAEQAATALCKQDSLVCTVKNCWVY